MTNIINKNLRHKKEGRVEFICNIAAGLVMVSVCIFVMVFAMISAFAPQWLMGGM